jgi:hypothetical protein
MEKGNSAERFLIAEVRPYLWRDRLKSFEKERGKESKHPIEYRIKIGKFEQIDQIAKTAETRGKAPEAELQQSDPLNVMSTGTENATTRFNAPRRLAFRFRALSHIQRLNIATKLALYENQDEGISDAELFRRIFKRAGEKRALPRLWEEVESLHADPEITPNPFEHEPNIR